VGIGVWRALLKKERFDLAVLSHVKSLESFPLFVFGRQKSAVLLSILLSIFGGVEVL
jgi:hypothetical protein